MDFERENIKMGGGGRSREEMIRVDQGRYSYVNKLGFPKREVYCASLTTCCPLRAANVGGAVDFKRPLESQASQARDTKRLGFLCLLHL